jgi:hypothetical protein
MHYYSKWGFDGEVEHRGIPDSAYFWYAHIEPGIARDVGSLGLAKKPQLIFGNASNHPRLQYVNMMTTCIA